ncbi:hypothetical protein VQL36_10220 [Chengkuizengella sp. SCS-71B]|uniref:hypothetical protein n=1 Tax=Chengkuizengella sp. SCS-71B TaxID=3115290 RepID=UPI0032C23035
MKYPAAVFSYGLTATDVTLTMLDKDLPLYKRPVKSAIILGGSYVSYKAGQLGGRAGIALCGRNPLRALQCGTAGAAGAGAGATFLVSKFQNKLYDWFNLN